MRLSFFVVIPRDDAADIRGLASFPEIVFLLKSEPELRGVPKVGRQTQSHIGTDTERAAGNFGDLGTGSANVTGQAILGNTTGFEEF